MYPKNYEIGLVLCGTQGACPVPPLSPPPCLRSLSGLLSLDRLRRSPLLSRPGTDNAVFTDEELCAHVVRPRSGTAPDRDSGRPLGVGARPPSPAAPPHASVGSLSFPGLRCFRFPLAVLPPSPDDRVQLQRALADNGRQLARAGV